MSSNDFADPFDVASQFFAIFSKAEKRRETTIKLLRAARNFFTN